MFRERVSSFSDTSLSFKACRFLAKKDMVSFKALILFSRSFTSCFLFLSSSMSSSVTFLTLESSFLASSTFL